MYACLHVCEHLWMPVHVRIKSKDRRQELSSIVRPSFSIRKSLSIKPWTCLCSLFLWEFLGIYLTVVLKFAHKAPNHWAPCQVPHSESKHEKEHVERAHETQTMYQLKSSVLAELLRSFSHLYRCGRRQKDGKIFNMSLWWPGRPTLFKIFIYSLTKSYMCAMTYNV